ncbi:hypothetical protein E4U61_007335 [Claviceps capensis]|nr:hypothetical protein E4U61_007335 [Claviceps capensis]
MESHTIHTGPTANHPDFTGFVDHLRDSLLHLPDPNQWIALNSRVEATERDVTDLKETMATMNTSIHSINDTLTAINNQLQQMRQALIAMDSRLTAMDLRIDARFNDVESRFNYMESRLARMASENNTRFTHTNSQLVELRTYMESKFASVDRTFADQNIRMGALHKNAMSRLDNRLPGASDDDLEPLFNLDTGQRIEDRPTRSGLDCMRSAALENCLHALGITPKESEDDKRAQLKKAYGAKTSV